MRADRNAARGEKGNRFHHRRAAFEFDDLGAGFHQFCGSAERLGWAFLKTAKRQIRHYQGALNAAGNDAGVVFHLLKADEQGMRVPGHHHANRIPDQNTIDTGGVGKFRKGEIIGGDEAQAPGLALGLVPETQVFAHALIPPSNSSRA